MKPSFVMAIVMVTFLVWVGGTAYAGLPANKTAGTTGYVLFICMLIGGLGALSPRSSFARSFVFRDGAPVEAVRRKGRWIAAYAAALAVAFLLVR